MCTDVVSIVVLITPTGTPTAGQSYALDCSVTGIADPATYQWFDSNGTQLTSTSQLQFSPLLASDAGTYICRATVGSVVLENSFMVDINCNFSRSFVGLSCNFLFLQCQLLLL